MDEEATERGTDQPPRHRSDELVQRVGLEKHVGRYQVGDAADRCGDHRPPRRHRLEERHRQRLDVGLVTAQQEEFQRYAESGIHAALYEHNYGVGGGDGMIGTESWSAANDLGVDGLADQRLQVRAVEVGLVLDDLLLVVTQPLLALYLLGRGVLVGDGQLVDAPPPVRLVLVGLDLGLPAHVDGVDDVPEGEVGLPVVHRDAEKRGDRATQPHRPLEGGGVDDETDLLGQLARRRLPQPFPRLHLAARVRLLRVDLQRGDVAAADPQGKARPGHHVAAAAAPAAGPRPATARRLRRLRTLAAGTAAGRPRRPRDEARRRGGRARRAADTGERCPRGSFDP